MRILKRIAIILSILVTLVIVSGFVFAKLYEDDVKQYILAEINNRLNTEIDVKEINFSVLQKFPNASLEFNTVTAEEVIESPKKGTLFSAKSIYLQFNILDIINENYIVKKIHVDNGLINVRIDKEGKINYKFWKEKNDSTKQQFNLELEDLKFTDFTFYTLNEYKNLDFAIEANQINLTGNFNEQNFKLKTNANLFVHQYNEDDNTLVKNKEVIIDTELDVNQEAQLFTITNGQLTVEDLNLALTGSLKNLKEGIDLNIESSGQDLSIESIFSLFPESLQNKISAYHSSGIITFNAKTTGVISAKSTPHFESDFTLNNVEILENSSNIALSNLSLTGNFTNGHANSSKTSTLSFKNAKATFGAGSISGSYSIKNLTNPYLEINSNANVDLAQAKGFFHLDTLEIAEGIANLNVTYSGYIKELNNLQGKDLRKLNAKGTAALENVSLKIFNNPIHPKKLNGAFRFNNNDILIDSLSTKVNSSTLSFSGKFQNLLAYLFIPEEKLAVYANIESPKLILDELLLDSKENNDSTYTFSLPDNIAFKGKAVIDTFSFRKFKANNVSSNIVYINHSLKANNVKLNTMEGAINGHFELSENKNGKFLMSSSANLTNINIHTLFNHFENFGQEYFIDKYIKGYATSTIDFVSVWDKQLNVDKDKIYVLANLQITKGELIDYQPILAMSKYIAVDELKHIKFSTLKTQIEIKNQLITIPKTQINSSAINLDLAGTHSFDNKIDYRFRLLLNDILWKKAKKNKKENTEFGYVEDDGLGRTSLFLHMTGTVDNYEINYDTKSLKDKWKADIKEEKSTIKKLLNKEFGWFKKDTTVTKSKKETDKKSDDGFLMEWEESNDPKKENNKSEQTNQPPQEKKEKKGLGKWLDKIAQPDEEEFEDDEDF